MARLLLVFLLFASLVGCTPDAEVALDAGRLEILISSSGQVTGLIDKVSGEDVLAPGISAPLLSLIQGDETLAPTKAVFSPTDSTLKLSYPQGLSATVVAKARGTHASFEVAEVSDTSKVDVVIWGPYPTTMNEVIGETVGVVQESDFALGLQALNPRTLGGYPWNDNDAMPQLDIFESGDYSDLSEEGKRYVLYRVEAAKPDSFGSTLQAYTRKRSRTRVVKNLGYDEYVAPPFRDGGVVGSSIALFGSERSKALETLGEIEVTEGLPHPMLDGHWAKAAPRAAQAYVIMPFSEGTAEQAMDVVEQAGMQILYHPDPFASWGHFELRKDDFPNGVQGLQQIAQRAEERGLRIGGHTLSNFVHPHDPYVSPVPDPRLARVGSTELSEPMTANQRTITIASPNVFKAGENSTLRTAVIGPELVQYAGVSDKEPWELLGVTRGAFGTRKQRHQEGAPIALLADHGYRVFLTNPDLTIEMAENLAKVFGQAGLRHISFDGLEGNRSTGMGNYGEILFAQAWYDALTREQQQDLIVTASRTSHYFWHLYTRMNWGEPWYAGFRESQTEYRMKNQKYFKRNFMPAMLGWFSLRPETSVEDIEWMLARSAAYDAGYALSTSLEVLAQNGRSDEMLTLMNTWERARLGGHFDSSQKARMEDVSGEFHLEEPTPGQFVLYPIHVQRFETDFAERQPGEPVERAFAFDNPHGIQTLEFSLHAEGGDLRNPSISLNGAEQIGLGPSIAEGHTLVYSGGISATLYSGEWDSVGSVTIESSALEAGTGSQKVWLGAPGSSEKATGKLELRLTGTAEELAHASAK